MQTDINKYKLNCFLRGLSVDEVSFVLKGDNEESLNYKFLLAGLVCFFFEEKSKGIVITVVSALLAPLSACKN